MLNIICHQEHKIKSHCTSIRMTNIKNTDHTKCCQWQRKSEIHCWWQYKMVLPLWKTFWLFMKKLNIYLPRVPDNKLLGIYPWEMKALCPCKILWMNIRSNLFYLVVKPGNNPNDQQQVDGWANYGINNEILFTNKTKGTTDTHSKMEKSKNTMIWTNNTIQTNNSTHYMILCT